MSDDAVRILARSMMKELKSGGLGIKEILTFVNEILSLLIEPNP